MKVRECRNILNQESHNPEGLRRSVEQIYCYSRVIHGGSGGAGRSLVKFDVCRRVVVLFGHRLFVAGFRKMSTDAFIECFGTS
jgi:hypothetical protein